jgi:uncharacterized protein DUF3105
VIDEPRETKKGKRDAARQARIEQQRRRQQAKRRKKAVLGGLSVVLVVALVAFAVVQISQSRARSQAAVKAAAAAAGCDGIIQYPDAGRQHIDNLPPEQRKPYTSTPPTSGDHYGVLPPPPNFYADPALRPETYVHALEHGQIFIHYNDIPKAQVDELEKLQSDHSASTSVMRDPDIKAPVVITAWRYMEQCQKVSVPVIEDFIKQRCNKGPENFGLKC